MGKQGIPQSDKRVPIALVLMGAVLALIGSQQVRGDMSAGSLGQPEQATLAMASPTSR